MRYVLGTCTTEQVSTAIEMQIRLIQISVSRRQEALDLIIKNMEEKDVVQDEGIKTLTYMAKDQSLNICMTKMKNILSLFS